jgi:uncharacterized RDD family membrane protein YckC
VTSQGILTGEGVLLDSPPASFGSRTVGALIDYALYGVVLVITASIAAGLGSGSDAVGSIATVVTLVTVMVIAPVTIETLSRGRSLGKLVVGICVVRDDGGPVAFRHALIRALVAVVEIWGTFGIVALLTSIAHPRGKRLGDLVAGTYAVRVRGGPSHHAPLVMPAPLAGWAARADIARLPDGLALTTRQFLARAARMHPASRVELGTRLTGQVQQYVRPLPPAGTHPELFLTAVLAERRERELLTELARTRRADNEADLLARLPYGVPDPEQ